MWYNVSIIDFVVFHNFILMSLTPSERKVFCCVRKWSRDMGDCSLLLHLETSPLPPMPLSLITLHTSITLCPLCLLSLIYLCVSFISSSFMSLIRLETSSVSYIECFLCRIYKLSSECKTFDKRHPEGRRNFRWSVFYFPQYPWICSDTW